MKKHTMAITYEPKIEPVRSGLCTQTIRKGCKISVGDSILLHGWGGKPYRSKWDWRKRVYVNWLSNCEISEYGMTFRDGTPEPSFFTWDSRFLTYLAELDYINPLSGVDLRDVLFALNGVPKHPEKYQIIRW